jgi:ribonuclease III
MDESSEATAYVPLTTVYRQLDNHTCADEAPYDTAAGMRRLLTWMTARGYPTGAEATVSTDARQDTNQVPIPATQPRGLHGRRAAHASFTEEQTAKKRPPQKVLQERIGFSLSPSLLETALTHRSFAYENGGLPTNERLEFLGDSVLGLIVTDTLYQTHPELQEGRLAKLRAAVVNARSLADVGRKLELGLFVRLGRGEESTGGRDKPSILADTLEAVIGAVFYDLGLDAASDLIHRLFDDVIAESAHLGAGLDWKTSLQELTASVGIGVPEYQVSESGPDHEKVFTAVVRVRGVAYGRGAGRNKKEAEQQAAQTAWNEIHERDAEQQ